MLHFVHEKAVVCLVLLLDKQQSRKF